MTSERMFEIMGNIGDKYVSEAAATPKARRVGAVKWAALAAALALAVGIGAVALRPKSAPGGGVPGGNIPGNVVPGGDVPGYEKGGEGVNYSVAVHPAGYEDSDVADAVVTKLSQAEAEALEGLGEYLPAVLPEGAAFYSASLYSTTMRDGAVFRMLRVAYSYGEAIGTVIEGDSGAEVQVYETFSVSVWDHRPDTDDAIYSPGDVTAELIEAIGGRHFHVDFGGVYLSVYPGSGETPEDLAAMVASIAPPQ